MEDKIIEDYKKTGSCLATSEKFRFAGWRGGCLLKIRVIIKNILKQFFLLDSFCKDCGVKIWDYKVDDDMWKYIMEDDYKKEVCYNCFGKRSNINWRVIPK